MSVRVACHAVHDRLCSFHDSGNRSRHHCHITRLATVTTVTLSPLSALSPLSPLSCSGMRRRNIRIKYLQVVSNFSGAAGMSTIANGEKTTEWTEQLASTGTLLCLVIGIALVLHCFYGSFCGGVVCCYHCSTVNQFCHRSPLSPLLLLSLSPL